LRRYGEFPTNQGPVEQLVIKPARDLLVKGEVKDSGLIYTSKSITALHPKVESLREEALQAELEAQAARYQRFGFPKRLEISNGKFKDMVMRLAVPQPEAYRERFDIPTVVIGKQIPAREQYMMMGFGLYLEFHLFFNVDPKNYKTPYGLHLVWMQDGRKNLDKSVDQGRAEFSEDERGENYYDGAGLFVARPHVLEDHSINLPSTDDKSGNALYLASIKGFLGVSYASTNNVDLKFGYASVGR